MRRKHSCLALSCLVTLLLVSPLLLIQSEAESKTIRLKAAAMAPRDMPVMLGFEVWGKEIEKRTQGRVKFDFYWSASLLKAAEQLRGVGSGLADLAIDLGAYHPSDTPFSTIGELGFITSQVDAPARALSDLYKTYEPFRQEFERNNVKILFFVPFPPTIMGFAKPVKALEDMKGKKVRALGVLNEVVANLGGTPLGIPVPELYESLSRGVVDGFTGFPLSAVKGFKIHEVVKNYLDFGYGNYLVEFIIINKRKWESLPGDIRRIMEEVSAEGIGIYTDLYAKEEPNYVRPLLEAGCSFHTLTPEEAARWKGLVVPGLWKKWVERNKKYGPAQEFFDRYLERIKHYEPTSTYVNPFPK